MSKNSANLGRPSRERSFRALPLIILSLGKIIQRDSRRICAPVRSRQRLVATQRASEHASRPIHPDVFSLLLHVHLIYSVLPSAYSFAPTFPVIIRCLSRQRCVTGNQTQRITRTPAANYLSFPHPLTSSSSSNPAPLFSLPFHLFRFLAFSPVQFHRVAIRLVSRGSRLR